MMNRGERTGQDGFTHIPPSNGSQEGDNTTQQAQNDGMSSPSGEARGSRGSHMNNRLPSGQQNLARVGLASIPIERGQTENTELRRLLMQRRSEMGTALHQQQQQQQQQTLELTILRQQLLQQQEQQRILEQQLMRLQHSSSAASNLPTDDRAAAQRLAAAMKQKKLEEEEKLLVSLLMQQQQLDDLIAGALPNSQYTATTIPGESLNENLRRRLELEQQEQQRRLLALLSGRQQQLERVGLTAAHQQLYGQAEEKEFLQKLQAGGTAARIAGKTTDFGSPSSADDEKSDMAQQRFKSDQPIDSSANSSTKKQSDGSEDDGGDDDEGVDDGDVNPDTFPFKLYRMLVEAEDEKKEDIVSFFPHGRAFAIHKPREFVAEIMPKYFTTSRMSSFQRQLNLYGFRRITEGRDKGGYYHDKFIKGKKLLCKKIRRKRTTVKAPPNFLEQNLPGAPGTSMSVRQLLADSGFVGRSAALMDHMGGRFPNSQFGLGARVGNPSLAAVAASALSRGEQFPQQNMNLQLLLLQQQQRERLLEEERRRIERNLR